jgi:hypothetical protein
MNRAKCNELDYIHFLIAAQKTFTCTEAARCQPEHPNAPAHDAFTRLLQRQPLDTEALWQEVQPCVQRQQGLLVIDDTTLDKPYAQKMDYVTYHWSGKHQRVVKGIALMTLLWTDGQALLPCDFRVYDKPFGGASKNAHFRAMLQQAWVRGFAPAYVVMDSWYASLENLKWIASVGWHFVTRLRSNRLVNPDGLGNRPISTVDIPLEGVRGASEGVWVGESISDGFPTRRRGVLGDERLRDDAGGLSAGVALELGDRGVSSGAQAVLWGGACAGAWSACGMGSFVVGVACVCAFGGVSFA